MEAEKKYKVALDVESALSSTTSWDSYIEAEKVRNKIEEDTGMNLNVYKIVTEVKYADRVSEYYSECR